VFLQYLYGGASGSILTISGIRYDHFLTDSLFYRLFLLTLVTVQVFDAELGKYAQALWRLALKVAKRAAVKWQNSQYNPDITL